MLLFHQDYEGCRIETYSEMPYGFRGKLYTENGKLRFNEFFKYAPGFDEDFIAEILYTKYKVSKGYWKF